MNRLSPILISLACALLLGCEASPPMTQTQVDALEIREIEAPPDRAYAAASNALLDSGYQLHVSDADAGIITAERRVDPSVATNTAKLLITAILTRGMAAQDQPPDYFGVCVEILPRTASATAVRMQTYLNGRVEPADSPASQKTVQELWTLMQRQVLMKDLTVPAAAPAPTAK